VHHAATLRIAEAATQAFDLLHAQVIPHELAAVQVGSTDASRYLLVLAAGRVVGLAAGAFTFARGAILRTALAILDTGTLTVATDGTPAALEGIHFLNAKAVPPILTAE